MTTDHALNFGAGTAAHVLVLTAELQDLLPGIINQLGPDNLSHLKKIAQQVSLHVSALWSCDVSGLPDGAHHVASVMRRNLLSVQPGQVNTSALAAFAVHVHSSKQQHKQQRQKQRRHQQQEQQQKWLLTLLDVAANTKQLGMTPAQPKGN